MTQVFDMMALNVTGVPQESSPRDESITSFAHKELLFLGTDFCSSLRDSRKILKEHCH
jgi:hypothetical protein